MGEAELERLRAGDILAGPTTMPVRTRRQRDRESIPLVHQGPTMRSNTITAAEGPGELEGGPDLGAVGVREGRLLGGVALVSMLAPLNSTMIAVALPHIAAEFRVGLGETAWLVVGYLTVVRFLAYLDLRIRREGWEVELMMRNEAARLTRQLT